CTLRGPILPPLPAMLPTVAFRLGIDLNPIGTDDADAVLWLRALIWPEHHERVTRLHQALEIASRHRPTILAGDALKLLPDAIALAPAEATIWLFHSFTLYQFTAEQRARLTVLLLEASWQRPVYRISFEKNRGAEDPQLWLFSYSQGSQTKRLLANCSAHGRW